MKRDRDMMEDDPNKKQRAERPTEPSRALYIGGLDAQTEYYDLCKVANQYGGVEFVKIVPQKHCAFLNFVTMEAAMSMHSAAQETPINVHGKDIVVGWAKSQPLTPDVEEAVASGATRNLFVAQITVNGVPLPEEILYQVFSKYGQIENVVVMASKGIAFVNMTSIKAAMHAMAEAEQDKVEVGGHKLIVKYAKEVGVTARPPPSRRAAPFVPQGFTPRAPYLRAAAPPQFQPQYPDPRLAAALRAPAVPGAQGGPSRAIFLGNLPEGATYQDVCKVANNYGPLEWAQINREKNNCFLNYISEVSAAALYAAAQISPITIGENQVRVGWAKAVPMKGDIAEAISQGATRNLFVGGIGENTTDEDLKALFDPFCKGEYDSIRVLREKKIAFVNLTNIKSAITAKTHFQNNPTEIDGVTLKVNFAKEKTGGPAVMPPSPARAPPPAAYAQPSYGAPSAYSAPPSSYASPSSQYQPRQPQFTPQRQPPPPPQHQPSYSQHQSSQHQSSPYASSTSQYGSSQPTRDSYYQSQSQYPPDDYPSRNTSSHSGYGAYNPFS